MTAVPDEGALTLVALCTILLSVHSCHFGVEINLNKNQSTAEMEEGIHTGTLLPSSLVKTNMTKRLLSPLTHFSMFAQLRNVAKQQTHRRFSEQS